jgi:excisionase family DNA binding protein
MEGPVLHPGMAYAISQAGMSFSAMGYSRQVVVDLVKKNRLKASKLGTHRRIKLSDLVDFVNQEDKQRSAAMTKLVEHTEEFGGYDQDLLADAKNRVIEEVAFCC